MSSLYDPEMFRRMTAPPGYQPPKPRGQAEQPPPYQPMQVLRGVYGGGDPPPYPQMSVRTTRLAQTDPRTGMTVFSEDPVAEEMHRGANQFNTASADNYNRQQFASQQAAQQMALEREKMQQAATLGREEMKNRIDVARIGADADRSWGRMTDQTYKDIYVQELMKHGDAAMATRQASAAVSAMPVAPPNSPRGIPAAAPGAGLPPGVPPAPTGGGTTPTLLPAAIRDLLGTSGVVPPGEGAKKLDAGKLADLLFNEQGRLKGAYDELADQLVASGMSPQAVVDAIQRQILTSHNTATGSAEEGSFGPYKIRKTYQDNPVPGTMLGMGSPSLGSATTRERSGYSIEGPGMEGGGIWYGTGNSLFDPFGAPWFSSQKSRGDAGQKGLLLADLLQSVLARSRGGQASPPPGAVPPR